MRTSDIQQACITKVVASVLTGDRCLCGSTASCVVQGGACYAEVHDLWQRVRKAEQAEAQAAGELRTARDAARQATLELKVTAAASL